MLKFGSLHLLDLLLHVGDQPLLPQLPIVVPLLLRGGPEPGHAVQAGLHLSKVVDGGLKSPEDVAVPLHHHQLLHRLLQVLKMCTICGEAEQALQDGQERDNFQPDVGNGVLGEAEELAEEVLLEVASGEEHHSHLTHLEEEHAGVTALAPGQLLLHAVQDVRAVLQPDGEPEDDQQGPDGSDPTR